MTTTVLITGASGMVGKGVLLECLDDASINAVRVLGRSSCGVTHPKLKEILTPNLFDLSGVDAQLIGIDACFFCSGVSSVGMSEADYSHITYDLTVTVAQTLLTHNPTLTFCYVSGQGTDASELGPRMWARVKGKVENALLKMPFKSVYMFRPGYIQPQRGIRSKTAWYQAFYACFAVLYPLLKILFPTAVTSTDNVGRAMINVLFSHPAKSRIETVDINRLAEVG